MLEGADGPLVKAFNATGKTDERLLRVELRQDQLDRDVTLARAEIADGRRVIESMSEHIVSIKETLTAHVIQEGRDRVKLFVGLSGGLVVGLSVLIMFIIQRAHGG